VQEKLISVDTPLPRDDYPSPAPLGLMSTNKENQAPPTDVKPVDGVNGTKMDEKKKEEDVENQKKGVDDEMKTVAI
jgi:hypothetical protein